MSKIDQILVGIDNALTSTANTLNDAANTLNQAKDKLNTWLNDRAGGLKSWAVEITDATSNINPNFGGSATSDFLSDLDSYKVRTDPRLVPPKTYDPNFDSAGNQFIAQSDDRISNLTTMDLWNATTQAKSLNGIIAAKTPLLPMIFGVRFPVSATTPPPPALTLFINPSSWSRTTQKVQQNQWTRRGVKTERWGEDLEQISAEGKLGGFYTIQTGLTRYHRWQTPMFRNLMELVQIYKNNGCTYGKSYSRNTDFVAPSNNRILDVGSVEILYGYELYIGNFESFEIAEDATTPHYLNYSFTFNCERVESIYDLNPTTSQQLASIGNNPVRLTEIDYVEDTVNEDTTDSFEEVSEEQSTFTTIPTDLDAPKNTLFPPLISGLGKQDDTKPFVFNANGGSGASRNSLKVDFRDSEEEKAFLKDLPQDPSQQESYISNFVASQKSRSSK